ncbi:MAG: folate family ECF transporter S component [Lachnospiraceae bacterium]
MQIFSKDAFNFRQQLTDMKHVPNLALCGVFVALYAVLSPLKIPISNILEIRTAFLALAVAGYIGGPIVGLFVGILGDFVSMFMPGFGGVYFPGFTIQYALLGLLFGIVLYRTKITIPRVIIAAVVHFLIGISIGSLNLWLMYGMPWKQLFGLRLLKSVVTLPVDSILLFVFLTAFVQIALHAGLTRKQKA